MANLTLSIEEEILKRGPSNARARGTSLNSLVRKFLADAVSTTDASVDAILNRLRQTSGDSTGKNSTATEAWPGGFF